MAWVVGSERYALQIIQELEKTRPDEIGEEMGFSAEYAATLCKSLWRGGYIRGTTLTGYEITSKGEEFLTNLGKSRK